MLIVVIIVAAVAFVTDKRSVVRRKIIYTMKAMVSQNIFLFGVKKKTTTTDRERRIQFTSK